MKPARIFARILEAIRATDGEITYDWVQQADPSLSKDRARDAIKIAYRKGLIVHSGKRGTYRTAPQPAGVV